MIFNSIIAAKAYNFWRANKRSYYRDVTSSYQEIKLLKAFFKLFWGHFFKSRCELFLYLKQFYTKNHLT